MKGTRIHDAYPIAGVCHRSKSWKLHAGSRRNRLYAIRRLADDSVPGKRAGRQSFSAKSQRDHSDEHRRTNAFARSRHIEHHFLYDGGSKRGPRDYVRHPAYCLDSQRRFTLLARTFGQLSQAVSGRGHPALEGDSDEISNWLHSSVVDIAFTVMPDKEMQTLPLLQDEMMVILPDTHPLKDSQTLRFSEIAERCFIMPKDGCIQKMLQENHINPTVTFEVREVYTILTMVQEYIGVTIMPELYMPPVIPKVVAIPLSPPITREVVLGVRNWQSISPLTAEFAVHSQQYVKAMDFTQTSK